MTDRRPVPPAGAADGDRPEHYGIAVRALLAVVLMSDAVRKGREARQVTRDALYALGGALSIAATLYLAMLAVCALALLF